MTESKSSKLTPFDAADYLDDPKAAAYFLELGLNESDELFDVMLSDVLRAQTPALRKQTFRLFFNRKQKPV